MLTASNAQSYASSATSIALPALASSETIGVYSRSLQVVWQASIGFSARHSYYAVREEHQVAVAPGDKLPTEEEEAKEGSNRTSPPA
ncbi:uncharacterized protein BDW70DRAFT_145955 [Aspergillus foveolatus]|uniref:uncharacterized protein n=1 Tax=Aspergillus foveolatus TaxID=210207 RepID=UPI003CCE3080